MFGKLDSMNTRSIQSYIIWYKNFRTLEPHYIVSYKRVILHKKKKINKIRIHTLTKNVIKENRFSTFFFSII